MEQAWFVAALWPLVAVVAGLIANWLKISTALSEIVVGTVAQLAIGALAGGEAVGAKAHWITFLAGTGAIVLRFLAGAELDPNVFRSSNGRNRRR
jgi:glutathione-regulated potassium-efflux system ancillary protein KefC